MGTVHEQLEKIERDVEAVVSTADVVVFRVAAFLQELSQKYPEIGIIGAMDAVVEIMLSQKPLIVDLFDLGDEEYIRLRNVLEGAAYYRGFHVYNLKEERMFLVVSPNIRAHEWPSLGWQDREL